MPQKYLKKFQGSIGKRQTQQIINLLNSKRNTGQIRSVSEFSEQLEILVRELTQTALTPTLSLFDAFEGAEIDSETYNFMLDRVDDDLVAAFEEANTIDEVQRSHEAIIRDVLLKNLRAGVDELESQITLYEFINKDLRGFDSAIFSTFRETKENRTLRRAGTLTQILFRDPRVGDLTRASQDATVELTGERLVLANASKTNYLITNARQIFDSDTPQSELIVEPPNNSLRNIIDNTQGTYWIQSLLFTEKKEFVKIQLELDLGVVKEVNFIDIEPATRYGIVLEEISYLDTNNVITNIGIDEQVIESNTSIRIRKVATKKIILSFRNENASAIQFEYVPGQEPLFSQAVLEPPLGIQPSFAAASADIDELLNSAKVKEVLGIKKQTASAFNGFDFQTGFDNIRIGFAGHASRSIYVSAPLEICGVGELGLKVLESRPYDPVPSGVGEIQFTQDTYDKTVDNESFGPNNDSSRSFLGSLEYWIIRQDIGADGSLQKTTTFPILPLGVQRLHHERLVLNEKSATGLEDNDIGTLMFFTNRTEGDIKVYRNFNTSPLEDNTTDAFATTGWKAEPFPISADLRTPNNGERMRFKIKILNPLPGDIYTVTYTPIVSTTSAVPELVEVTTSDGLKVVDLVGDLTARSSKGQVVILDKIGEDDTQKVSKIYLVIILRRNTAESSITPIVEEYTLVAGCKDPAKFEEV